MIRKSLCRVAALVSLTAAFTACSVTPPAPAAAPVTASINAPFAKSWNAVIDVLAENNIPTSTLDRASGYMVARTEALPGSAARRYTTCDAWWASSGNLSAVFNAVVRGDSTTSTARVTATYTLVMSGDHGDVTRLNCPTNGSFEATLEQLIKAKAEAQ